MTQRPYELLVRFANDGSIGGASIRYITTVNGRDYEGDPLPLQGIEDPAFVSFAQQFGAAAIAEREQARADLATMTAERDSFTQQLATVTSERDSLTDQLATATSTIAERDATIVERELSLQSATTESQARINAMTSERDAALARITELQSQLPWDRRIIDASAFLARVSKAELLDLTTSADPTRQQIAQMLAAYRTNDWPIMLDSPEMQHAIGYLQQSEAISVERAAELLRDSSREEAYKAGA